ncbi:hypothetical protein [Streptomyces sp. NPDC007088]|uniref:hypothetical protein n=1 Tax=Streptomyces sp. NPDC007088 TaxID=3364773 RepID=UPI00367A5137
MIEPVHRAIALAELLHATPADGAPLFGRFAFGVRCKWFRKRVNSDAAGRLGLACLPAGPANLRMLRRALAREMAYRPGGVLATKTHLEHISVATTPSRPGQLLLVHRPAPGPLPEAGRDPDG